MILKSDRLNFKIIELSDLEHLHMLHSIPEVDEFNTMGLPEHMAETNKHLQDLIDDFNENPPKSYSWMVFIKETDQFIGEAGISLSNDRFKLGEIYFKFLPEYWGKGFATECAKTLIKFGFEELKLHKVEAGVATENLASIKVLEKSGMIREGLRRKILPIRGEWKDNYHYAIAEDDPRP